jgi:hypothetical protein
MQPIVKERVDFVEEGQKFTGNLLESKFKGLIAKGHNCKGKS